MSSFKQAAVVLQALRDKCANWRTLDLVRCQLDAAYASPLEISLSSCHRVVVWFSP
jgi:hypothetical protein